MFPATVISIDNISYEGINDQFVVALVVDQSEELFVITRDDLQNRIDPTTESVQVTSELVIGFSGQPSFCELTILRNDGRYPEINFDGQIPFWETQANDFILHTPYNIDLVSDNAELHTTLDVAFGVSPIETFNTSAGQVKLQNLGSLYSGVECPEVTDIAFFRVPSNGQYALISAAQFHSFVADMRANNFGFIPSFLFLAEIEKAINGTSIHGSIGQPAGIAVGNFNNLQNSFNEQGAIGQLAYNFPVSIANPFVTLFFDADIVGKIVVSPDQSEPVIVQNGVRVITEPVLGEVNSGRLEVTVQNNGMRGTVRVTPQSLNGNSQFDPRFREVELENSAQHTFSFDITGVGEASGCQEQVIVTASSTSAFGGTDTQTICMEVKPRIADPVCGDGLCQAVERDFLNQSFFCPVDCEGQPPIPEPPTDGDGDQCNFPFIEETANVPTFAFFGFEFGHVNVGTGNCVLDGNFVVLSFLILFTILAIVVIRGMK